MSEKKKQLSRRDFLKGAAGAAGVAALGMLAGCKQDAPTPTAEGTGAEKVYTPGTYTASAQGMESAVTVTIEVDESKILSATVDTAGETVGLGAPTGEKLAQEILDKQSIDIDGVSGATVTSKAAKTALEDCIAQAKGIDVNLLRGENNDPGQSSADWLGEAPEIKDSEVVKTIDTDVLVIGAGTAGLFAAAAAVAGWGGLSVHCQVLSFLGESGLSTRTYIGGKLLHGLFSAGLTALLLRAFPLKESVSSYLAQQVEGIAGTDFYSALAVSTAAAWGVFLLFFLLAALGVQMGRKTSGKRRTGVI